MITIAFAKAAITSSLESVPYVRHLRVVVSIGLANGRRSRLAAFRSRLSCWCQRPCWPASLGCQVNMADRVGASTVSVQVATASFQTDMAWLRNWRRVWRRIRCGWNEALAA